MSSRSAAVREPKSILAVQRSAWRRAAVIAPNCTVARGGAHGAEIGLAVTARNHDPDHARGLEFGVHRETRERPVADLERAEFPDQEVHVDRASEGILQRGTRRESLQQFVLDALTRPTGRGLGTVFRQDGVA